MINMQRVPHPKSLNSANITNLQSPLAHDAHPVAAPVPTPTSPRQQLAPGSRARSAKLKQRRIPLMPQVIKKIRSSLHGLDIYDHLMDILVFHK